MVEKTIQVQCLNFGPVSGSLLRVSGWWWSRPAQQPSDKQPAALTISWPVPLLDPIAMGRSSVSISMWEPEIFIASHFFRICLKFEELLSKQTLKSDMKFFLTLAINRLALNIWSFIAPFLVNRNPTVLATGRSHPWTRKASTEVLERRRRVGDLWPRKFRKNPSLLITLKLDAGDSRAWYDKPFKRRNSTKKKLILSRCAIRPPLAGLMVKYGEIATP